MKYNSKKHRPALTLIEVMVVVLIIAVAVLGAMGFRFYATTDAKKADVQINAMRISSMILENWKVLGGHSSYNPTPRFTDFTSEFSISGPVTGPTQPTGFQPLTNKYKILDKNNNINYFITLSYQNNSYQKSGRT